MFGVIGVVVVVGSWVVWAVWGGLAEVLAHSGEGVFEGGFAGDEHNDAIVGQGGVGGVFRVCWMRARRRRLQRLRWIALPTLLLAMMA